MSSSPVLDKKTPIRYVTGTRGPHPRTPQVNVGTGCCGRTFDIGGRLFIRSDRTPGGHLGNIECGGPGGLWVRPAQWMGVFLSNTGTTQPVVHHVYGRRSLT